MAIKDSAAIDLLDEDLELLDLLLEEDGDPRPAAIPRSPHNTEAPLSLPQKRLWVLAQLDPTNASYNVSGALAMPGPLDYPVLRRSCEAVVRRHEVLRTTFETRRSEGRQVIRPPAPWRLPLVSLSRLTPPKRRAELDRLAREHARRPFDLTAGPLFSTVLVILRRWEHVLLLNMHHIIADGASLGILLRELAACYEAFSAGGASPLPELPLQYADFARWQRRQLPRAALERQLDYWCQELAGSAVLDLPADRPRPPVRRAVGAQLVCRFPPGVAESLREESRKRGTTLFVTLLAAFQAFLARITGERDVCVGSPISLRNRAELEPLIGFFVNTLVLRARVGGDPPFADFLDETRRVVRQAWTHQDVPLEELAEALKVERDPSRTPLFQVMFTVHESAPVDAGPARLTWTTLPVDNRTSKCDLTLELQQEAAGLSGMWEYDTDLFTATTVRRMAGQLAHLLTAVAADPRRKISRLPLLGAAESHQLLCEWNDKRSAYPRHASIATLFSARARQTPDRPAVSSDDGGGTWLSYGELNRRANQLAHHLLRLGVGPESLVALSIERSPRWVTALLAISKAGGAYLPLDPDYPPARRAFMLRDSGARVLILGSPAAAGELEGLAGDLHFVNLETDRDRIAGPPRNDPVPWQEVGGENLAYVIYTSGSTGTPKGIGIVHGAISRLVCDTDYVQIRADDIVAQVSNASFDAATFEVWGALFHGARLQIVARDDSLAPAAFADLLERQRVTTLFLTTALFNQVAAAFPAAFRSLRHLLFGGQMVDPQWVRRVLHEPSGRFRGRLLHVYGPTESTTFASWFRVRRRGGTVTVPIGGPLAGTALYVLDPFLRSVPLGVAGELFIGGDGLARGYHRRARWSAASFLPDPVSGESSRRMYRSGDRARWLVGGALEFLGRADHQVKIRGFRIEPGEIEAALGELEAVRQSAVVAHHDESGERRLVAYVVGAPAGTGTLTAGQLRRHLARRLPAHMIPAVFVQVDALPLTPNGKIDRAALPAPPARRPELDEAFLAPRGKVETLLAEIWQTVLGLGDPIGVHDNFFELGGDSILSIQIASRAARAGLALTPKQVFEHQSVAELAAVAQVSDATRRRPAERTEPDAPGEVPLVPIQHWFFEADPAEPHHFNQSVLLEVDAKVGSFITGAAILERALQDLLDRHGALRFRFVKRAAGWRQMQSAPGAALRFHVTDLSRLSPPHRLRGLEAAGARLQASLSLAEGPLLRAVYVDLGDGLRKPPHGRRLLLVVHHLVVDGVSWRILLEDLENACGALRRGRLPRFGAPTAAFSEWARRLAEPAVAEAFAAELAYWRRLASVSPALPFAEAGAEENTHAALAAVAAEISETETRELLTRAGRAYRAGIEDLLLTALAGAFERHTGQRDVLLALEGHGRGEVLADVDLTRTVGWFTAVYPVLLRAVPGDLGATLKRVKEDLRSVPRRGLGYGWLRYLSPNREVRREMASLPEPLVSYNYLGQLDAAFAGAAGEGGRAAAPLLRPAVEPCGPEQSPRARRRHVLDVVAAVGGGRLRLKWLFNARVCRRSDIETLARTWTRVLRELLEHCRTPGAGGLTPSDVPVARLDQAALDRLPVEAARVESIYPLSPMQEGMLFHSLHQPESRAYLELVSWEIRGELDKAALDEAWRRLAARHPVLRTSLVWQGLERPHQVVHRRVEVPVEYHDWRQVDPAEAEKRVDEAIETERGRGFDLSRAPLLRRVEIALPPYRSGESAGAARLRILWSFHHVLLDGWSLSTVLGELLRLYEILARGEQPALEPVRPFEDYVAWLEERGRSDAEAFWAIELRGFSEPTPLGFVRSHTPPDSRVDFPAPRLRLSPTASTALQSMARRSHLTLNTVVQGAWALLLHRYSGARDVVFGVTVSGRSADLAGVEKMVGLFINTLPLRIRTVSGAPILPWLRRLQARQTQLREHGMLPLAEIGGFSDVPPGRPLFESILIFENYPLDRALAEPPFTVTDVRTVERTNYPLTVVTAPGHVIELCLSYDPQQFRYSAIRRALSHFRHLLEGLAAAPDRNIGEVGLLSAGQCRQLLVEHNDSAVSGPPDIVFHQVFEQWVPQIPQKVALTYTGDGHSPRLLSYAGLDRRANQMAHYLRSRGVGPEIKVGLCLERSLDQIVSLLGVLKAGGAYLPLAPDLPPERLRFVLADADAALVMTQSSLISLIPADAGPEAIVLDELRESLARQPGDTPALSVGPENLAYMIYTSGSTGRPKGVLLRHRGLANLQLALIRAFGIRRDDRVLQFATPSFDASISDVCMSLAAGNTLVLAPGPTLHSRPDLERLIKDAGISVATLPPALLEMLSPELPRLRLLISAGEACSRALVEKWAPGRRFINAYGPSETTVCATWNPCRSAEPGPPPIGRPIPNVRTYVVGSDARPVPHETLGELWIGGAGVGRGYRGQPALTARRFVPDAWSRDGGARAYRSGDLARWRADGRLEYLGRSDHQVKIRGFRVELGEIEEVLKRLDSVAEAFVTVSSQGSSAASASLKAFVVPRPAAEKELELSPRELREALRGYLPDYMIPHQLTVLDALPLTSHGKVDVRRLAALESSPVVKDEPQTRLERRIAELWAELLHLDAPPGSREHFFELGGNSILLIRLQSRLENLFGKKLSMVELFEQPTVHGLAGLLSGRNEPSAAPEKDRARVRTARKASALQQQQQRQLRTKRRNPGNT